MVILLRVVHRAILATGLEASKRSKGPLISVYFGPLCCYVSRAARDAGKEVRDDSSECGLPPLRDFVDG